MSEEFDEYKYKLQEKDEIIARL